MSEPRRYRFSWLSRLSARWECHPAWTMLVLGCMGYVAILLAWCARHAATGVW